ncbi:MAG: GNAT family N-acetyltransferase, partial [Candidatus Thorarchaeota archaeon]
IAEIIYKANSGSIDVQVFPEFFSTIEAVNQLLENIENDRYGKYKEPHSKIISCNGKFIGVCFLTMTSDDTGYIPDIALLPEYRGKGLGKSLLIYSLKEMMNEEEGLKKNNLDVTKANPAKHLYESLGYEDVTHYSMFNWTKS